jgi:multidrug transporter EmrE-like cation transporter
LANATQPIWPFFLPIAGFVTYSLVLKTVRSDLHPLLFLSIAYAVAFAIATALWVAWGNFGSKVVTSTDVFWAVLLGVSLVVIEFGFLLTLRNGWPVGVAATTINVATATLLLGIGMFLYKEHLSAVNIAGAALCIGGLILITWK